MNYLLKLYLIVYPDANINALGSCIASVGNACSNGLIGEHLTMYRIGVQCN